MAERKKESFVTGAAVLTASTIIIKILGAVFKIPLSNIIGVSAMGDFGIAYNIYALLLTISTAGLPVALSRMVSASDVLGHRNQVKRTFRVAWGAFFVMGLLSTLFMLLFHRSLAEFMGSPANYFLNRYFGKRISGTLFTPIMVVGLGLYAFVDAKTPSILLFLATVLYNFGFSGPGFALDTIQPDITDVDELITGRRREGVIATFRSFVAKTISSFMTGVLGFSMKAFGYNVKLKEPIYQTARTRFGIRLIFTYMPIFFGVMTYILVRRFAMNKKDHETIQRVIREKREGREPEITPEEKERLELIAGRKWDDMWIGNSVVL